MGWCGRTSHERRITLNERRRCVEGRLGEGERKGKLWIAFQARTNDQMSTNDRWRKTPPQGIWILPDRVTVES